jgi:hypothetical protein
MPGGMQKMSVMSRVGVATGTAVDLQYPMWLMPVSEFLKLTKLEPHQKLRAENRIVQWDTSMKHIFFMSHQWTSFSFPDQSGDQLGAMQRIVLRMMARILPKTSPCIADAAYLPSSANVTTKEWATMVEDAHIWMECVMPQRPCKRATHQAPFDVARLAQLHLGASDGLVL